jgi:hypothetical protein
MTRRLNGLTDGWARLLESVDLVYKQFGSDLTQVQLQELKKFKKTVSKVVYRT